MIMSMRNSPLYLPILSILVAVELVLAFSAFGYIVIPPISFTLMPLPVLIGALLFGPAEGMVLGGIFGLTSIWKASVTATAYADQIFSPFISGAPVSSLIVSVGMRMAFGFLAGCLFLHAKKNTRYKKACIAFAAILADFLHSFLVITAIQILFPESGITLFYGLLRKLSLQNFIEWGVVGLLIIGVYAVSNSKEILFIRDEIKKTEGIAAHPKILLGLAGFILLMFLLTLGLWYHFYNRTEMILRCEGVAISEKILSQFWQLGAQFLVAVISLFLVVSIVLILTEKYLLKLTQQAKRDLMTGLYNKMTLTRYVDMALRDNNSGFLLILDVDNFKRLNDTYGHPAGDKVLISIASILQAHFNGHGMVGRLGGDEFCVYVSNLSKAKMIEKANKIGKDIAALSISGTYDVSCSIGVAFCEGKRNFMEAYTAADQALYHSKELGKNRCSFERAHPLF